ncbi:MAG: LpxD N-terminal domain-containing protein, partial [Vulcanimicrobiaceae bacterium]
MTLGDYAGLIAADVRGDPTIAIERIAAIDDVDARALTFAVDERYLRAALAARPGAVLTEPALAERVGSTTVPLLLVPSVRAALAALLAALERPRPQGEQRDPSAAIDPSAALGPGVRIGPLARVGAGARIGARSVLLAGAIVGDEAVLGADCLLH